MVSIIVPVYNAEKYLGKCVESILTQTYKDFELYLVDDGSSDRSGALCDEYATKDSRVKVIHCENGGVAMARQRALDVCSGEYICYVDSDDYISEDYVQRLYEDITKENADMACCKTLHIDGDKESLIDRFTEYEVVLDKSRFVKDFLDGKDMYNKVVWAKMFRKSAIADVKFKPLNFGEDTLYMYEAFAKINKTVLDPFVGYFYYRNSDSITKKAASAEKEARVSLDHILALEALSDLGREVDSSDSRRANRKYASAVFSAISRTVRCGNKKLYAEKRAYLCKHIKNLKNREGISGKLRVVLTFYRLFPGLFWVMFSTFIKIRK